MTTMQPATKRFMTFMGIMLIIMSAMALGGIIIGYHSIVDTTGYISTTGQVVDLATTIVDIEGTGGVAYAPVIQYTDSRTNIPYTGQSNVYTYPPEYSVGQEISILFNPNNPESFVIPSDNNLSIIAPVGLFLASIFLIIGIYFLISFRRS